MHSVRQLDRFALFKPSHFLKSFTSNNEDSIKNETLGFQSVNNNSDQNVISV